MDCQRLLPIRHQLRQLAGERRARSRGSCHATEGNSLQAAAWRPTQVRLRDDEKFFGERKFESELELELTLLRDKRKLYASQDDMTTKQRRLAYKSEAFADVDSYGAESKYYRRAQNVLQGILIVGSLATTGIAGISLISPLAKWGTIATSL
jgi:hypothetical protein